MKCLRALLASDLSIDDRDRVTRVFRGINGWGDLGRTPLSATCEYGRIEAVQLLLGNGADVGAEAYQCTPLSMASQCGHAEIVRVVLEFGADVN